MEWKEERQTKLIAGRMGQKYNGMKHVRRKDIRKEGRRKKWKENGKIKEWK